MVKIRLARYGKKNDPFYRIVAIDERKKREGKYLDIIGFWHPREKNLKVNKKKIDLWVQKGAQVSPGVNKILKKEG